MFFSNIYLIMKNPFSFFSLDYVNLEGSGAYASAASYAYETAGVYLARSYMLIITIVRFTTKKSVRYSKITKLVYIFLCVQFFLIPASYISVTESN